MELGEARVQWRRVHDERHHELDVQRAQRLREALHVLGEEGHPDRLEDAVLLLEVGVPESIEVPAAARRASERRRERVVAVGGGVVHLGSSRMIASDGALCMSVERTNGCMSGVRSLCFAASACATSYIRFQLSSEPLSSLASKSFAPFCTKFLTLWAMHSTNALSLGA